MRSPVLFLIFNRPALTRETFACIRQARPPRLYVAADGPREGREGEAALCEEAREAATRVDWPCEVKTLFRKRNLGCAEAVSSAVTWFFRHEPEGVILEDDLLIHPDFFPFCDEMLERYRNETSVMHIHGDNFQYGLTRGDASYYFSCFSHCWGWASWARAWEKYDHAMTRLNKVASRIMPKLFRSEAVIRYFRDVFTQTQAGRINSWAYRWTLSVWQHEGLCVSPNVNMVRNTGFGTEGTHTNNPASIPAYLSAEGLAAITHPQEITRDVEADDWVAHTAYVHGHSPFVLLQEALRRMETGTPDGVLGIVRVLRAARGDSAPLRQLEALALLQKGLHAEALATAAVWLEREPSSGEAKNLVHILKNAMLGKISPQPSFQTTETVQASYAKQAVIFEKDLTDPERIRISASWFNKNTADYWRHARMYEAVDCLLSDLGASWLTVGDGRWGLDSIRIKERGFTSVLATDISETLLAESRKRGYIESYAVENAEKMNFEDNSFDFVFCKESFHHFPRPYIALYEMIRVAKRGVFLIEPNGTSTAMEQPAWEPSGNYIYRLSASEIERVAYGLNLPQICLKGLNDHYIVGCEFEPADSEQSDVFRTIVTKIRQMDAACGGNIAKYRILMAGIFKQPLPQHSESRFRERAWIVKTLQRNPYL